MTKHSIVAITGGAGALGSALASHLAGKGYRLALLDTARHQARLAELVKSLGGQDRAIGIAGNFATASEWPAALATIENAFGAKPSHAVLVAGGWDGGAPLYQAKDDAVFDTMMTSNVDTAYQALHALLPDMVAKKAGSVVVIGSRAVPRPWTSAGAAAYAAAKGAVVTMAQAVAEEVLEHGVRVNAILPSTLDTPANRAAMPDADPSRWVSLESASNVIAFLLSDESRDVSGAAIPVYGRS
ncbi:short-chain dehydrogenase/reductase SDR [Labilithrix luteola]|uniref:Short-chain dehydrogenase/reductase SDR n=1 Tax=Labilithrix luteola TaxID=1391654 RepID=A0A0K1PXW2_9BACT|nr:SDR family NAD(P)-dependent oxidoreductase [Labilithrix luteola]AKU97989.1 short-chain dehydrogenase/reductase SDR [Labilithrix luteola]